MSDGVPFGKYLIVKRLAAGGMAELFLARTAAEQGGRPIALKRLLPLYSEDAERAALFLAEARIAAQLSHPYLVQIHEVGMADRQLYLAMEYVHGVHLLQVLQAIEQRGRTGVPWPFAARIVCWVLEALEYAHALCGVDGKPLGLVHRDVNPSNIMLGHNGAPKLIDFGIARMEAGPRTQPGVVKAKLEYAAPEQYRSEPVDARTDVYGAALTLYELLTGHNPFFGHSPRGTIDRVLEHVPADARSVAEVPAALSEAIRAGMEKDPRRRPASASRLRGLIEECLFEARAHVGMPEVAAFLSELFPGANRLVLPTDSQRGRPSTRPLTRDATQETGGENATLPELEQYEPPAESGGGRGLWTGLVALARRTKPR